MMKICLLSDSHGNRRKVEDLIVSNEFDYVFFMGDGLRDFDNIDETILKKVCGNCDFFSQEAVTQFVTINGVKIMITHGHEFKAKLTPLLMVEKAKQNNCNIVCYGHTHVQKYDIVDEIGVLNPGAFSNFKGGKRTYAVIEVDNKKINVNMLNYLK